MKVNQHLNPQAGSECALLGEGWKWDENGYATRKAARLILVNSKREILLIKGQDFADSSRTWWFTPGGGITEGESAVTAAQREVKEETGIILDPAKMLGPIMHRHGKFRFKQVLAKQEETYYLYYLQGDESRLDPCLTQREQRLLGEQRWFGLSELANTKTRIFPEILPQQAREWVQAWQGRCLEYVDK